MSVQTHKRPDLKASIERLIAQLLPAIRSGGSVPLVALVEAVVADGLDATVRATLAARADVCFHVDGADATFENEGPAAKIELKRFAIKIPSRLSGRASLAGDGAVLRFTPKETLSATKLFFSVPLERIEVSSSRVFVDMEGDSFDQVLELG